MTVDEILATGQYRDRRGREWKRGPSFVCNRDWFYLNGIYKGGYANDTEMRLLIERDQHRDECEGLGYCLGHPVPHVIVARYRPAMFSIHEAGGRSEVVDFRHDLPAAVDAARALAVGE